jgi:hypothetical protein
MVLESFSSRVYSLILESPTTVFYVVIGALVAGFLIGIAVLLERAKVTGLFFYSSTFYAFFSSSIIF